MTRRSTTLWSWATKYGSNPNISRRSSAHGDRPARSTSTSISVGDGDRPIGAGTTGTGDGEILITVGIIHPTTVPRGDGTGVGTITGDGTTIGAGVVRVTTRLTGVAAATTTLRGTSCTANRVTAVTALRPDIIRTPAPVQVTAAEATGAAEAPRPLPRAIVLRARIRQPAEELHTAEDRRVPQRAA